jgi:hypothetical protein
MWYTVDDKLAINLLTYNFLPSWWRGNYGLSFGRKFAFDADYRVELHRFMNRNINSRFPGLHIGSKNPPAQVILPDFGNAITAAAAGCEVVYPEDNYPWNRHLPLEKIETLQVPPDLRVVFPYSEITRQVAYLNQQLGLDSPPNWNSRGVLNDAALIGGPAFLEEFGADSHISRHLIDYSNGMLTKVIRSNHELFHYQDMVMLTNCTIMMVSPTTYEKRLLSYDLEVERLVASQGQTIGVHHCGSFEKYAHVYQKMQSLTWLEIGWGSDYRLALDLFPKTIISYILSAVFVATSTRQEVREAINHILETTRKDWHRFRMTMPDVEAGTPDENLIEIYECCKKARKWSNE